MLKIWYKRYKGFMANILQGMSLNRKIGFIILNGGFSFYVAVTRYFVYQDFSVSGYYVPLYLLWTLLVGVLVFHGSMFVYSISMDLSISRREGRDISSNKTFIWTFGILSVILGLSFLAYFPGGISNDNAVQWLQVQSFDFDNWHPAIHTILIWFASRVINHYSFIVALQILAFSASVGYLMVCLKDYGFGKWWLRLVMTAIIINPDTRNILMFAWKDNGLSILLLLLLGMTIRVWQSDGRWLEGWLNRLGIAGVIALASLIRHNGFFYTVPFLLFMILAFRHRLKAMIWLSGLVLLGVWFIRVPLYGAFSVSYPIQTYQESIGLPMTILGDIYVQNPEALSTDTVDFLEAVAPAEQWKEQYHLGDYNSIKFWSKADVAIKNIPFSTFIGMVGDAIGKDWRNGFSAVRELTDMVWESRGMPEASIGTPYVYGQAIGYSYEHTDLNIIGTRFMILVNGLSGFGLVDKFLRMTGTQILLVMFAGLIAFGRKGLRSLALVIPLLAYDFGTMLLLCGNDYRFFQFNALLFIPIILILLSAETTEMGNNKKTAGFR